MSDKNKSNDKTQITDVELRNLIEFENPKDKSSTYKNSNKNKFFYNIKYYIYLRYVFLFIFLIYFILTFNLYQLHKSYDKETFIVGGDRHYIIKELINKYNKFTSICTSGKLIDNKTYHLLERPKISVTIPIYNGGKYLYYSLRSIQNQNMKDIEIILIDDCSTDDSASIIEKYMREDPRIKFIQNKKNRKVLYSKSIAALNSNGKYIFQFDHDDILIREDVLEMMYNEAEKNNLDLVHVRDIYKNELYFNKRTRVNYQYRHMLPYQETHEKRQPELKDNLFKPNNDYILWGLLIKTDIYKKAVCKLWPIIINYKLVFYEDHCISFMIILLAKNYKYLNNFAIIHLSHKNAASNYFWYNEEFYISYLFFANILYDNHIKNNPQDIHLLFNLLNYTEIYTLKSFEFLPKFFNLIIKKVLVDNYSLYDEVSTMLNQLKIKIDDINIWTNYEQIMNSTEYNSIYHFQNNFKNLITKKNKGNKTAISIIILCTEFNQLKNTIYSIESQNFENNEVIIIYDNDNQAILDEIKNFIKLFPNIKIINNKEQKGLFYSYLIGIIFSKSNYILFLPPGYTLAKQNTLNELYQNLEENKDIDILEFNLLININDSINNNSLSLYRCPHHKTEINITKLKYNLDYIEIDQEKEILNNKIIKAEPLKKIIETYELNKGEKLLYNYFDDIILYLLNKNGAKFNYINSFYVIKNNNQTKSLSLNKLIKNETQIYLDSLFYINFLFENSKNENNEKEFALKEFYNIMNIIYNKENNGTEESNLLYQKFMNCKYISDYDKNLLALYHKSLMN